VPGTRKDIGAQIKTTLERYAQLNEGNLSGMVALNLQNASLPHGHALDAHDVSTQPFMRPDTAKTDVSPIVPSAGSTIPDLQRSGAAFSTVPGLAPPPIPVPPGITPPPGASPGPAGPAKTILGLNAVKKPQIPGVIPPIARPNGPPGPPPPRRATPPPMPVVKPPDDVIEEPSGLIEVPEDMTPLPPAAPSDSDRMPAQMPPPSTLQGLGAVGSDSPAPSRPVKPTPGQNFETLTGEMSPLMQDELNKRSVKNTAELQSVAPSQRMAEAQAANVDDPGEPYASESRVADHDRSSSTQPSMPPPGAAPTPVQLQTTARVQPLPVTTKPTKKSSNVGTILLALLVVGGLGAAGWYAYTTMSKKNDVVAGPANGSDTPKRGSAGSAVAVVKTTVDAGVAKVTPDAAAIVAATTPDAAVVAAAKPDAAVASPPEVKPPEIKPTQTSDKLEIKSKPKGARVFIDGADQGTSPVKLNGSSDRHTMVLFAPGHDLYIGEVDGHGVFDITLKPVTPTGGHAGIKVLKCKAKERYYVYVDGAPTGMTCPTERIDTVVGAHTVEVYDIVTDSRRKFDVTVKDERLSARVKIDD
jgi:hypothetical protein